MASINSPARTSRRVQPVTHEGAPAKRIDKAQQLRRVLNACLLWENTCYVDGVEVAESIRQLVPEVDAATCAELAIKAREEQKLRHAPLLVVREMARASKAHKALVKETLARVIQRPDEITEFLAIYWKDKKQPLAAQVKKGLAAALKKFNEYSLAKYDRDGEVKLCDVLALVHPHADNDEQYQLFGKIAKRELKTPDTWEVAMSGGADKKETFTRLMQEKKLGALATLKNLRNMVSAGVDENVLRPYLAEMPVERVLPFRFLSAAKYAPKFEPELEQSMFRVLTALPKLPGKTVLLVDASGSMEDKLSEKSELLRYDAACGLAILLRELCQHVVIFNFSTTPVLVPTRRGFALRDELHRTAEWRGTRTEDAKKAADREGYDRLIILTDEQSHQVLSKPKTDKGYVVNVATYQNGVGYGAWHHIDGWSEAILSYIMAEEGLGTDVSTKGVED